MVRVVYNRCTALRGATRRFLYRRAERCSTVDTSSTEVNYTAAQRESFSC